jgi:hypothetical protein
MDQTYTKHQLLEEIDRSRDLLINSKIEPGTVVGIRLPLLTLFENPTVNALCKTLDTLEK